MGETVAAAQRPAFGQPADGGMTKDQLRAGMMKRLASQREDVRARKSQAIARKVLRLEAFREAAVVCCYVALPYEVQTWWMIEAMLERGKRIGVPIVRKGTRRLGISEVRDPAAELVPGAFGVCEPAPWARRPLPLQALDLVLVPGVVFDRRGYRLGHGYGYFDRFLARLPKRTMTVGLAFRFQLLDRLPTTLHDHAVHTVVTA
jgi:5-formyltetrahydrofolate cyclo-ligase